MPGLGLEEDKKRAKKYPFRGVKIPLKAETLPIRVVHASVHFQTRIRVCSIRLTFGL